MVEIKAINMCLYVRNVFPHPAAGPDFPLYIKEYEQSKLIGKKNEYDKYISTIVILYGENKWDSYEIYHNVANVENVPEDEFGRYTKLAIQHLINKLIEIMKHKGIDITGTPINYKTYRNSYPLKVIKKKSLILPKHLN